MANVEAPPPVMPARFRASYDVSPEAMRVVFRPRSWATAIFLSLWLTGWTTGCVLLAHEVFNKPQLFMFLFGIPFWIAWIVTVLILVGSVTRRQELIVESQGLRYVDRAVIRLKNRWIPRDEFRGFDVVERVTSRNNSNSTVRTGLEIRSAGKPLFIFAGLPNAELNWLAYQLSQLTDALPAPAASADSENAGASAPTDSGSFPQTLALSSEEIEPPSDCSWQMLPDFGGVWFVHFGRWSWGAVLGLLFINGFWNGIVGVFVLNLLGLAPGNGPVGGDWWFLFFFLIPFEVIGLLMFVGLVFTMLEPVRRLIWTFDARQIECRLSWLGLGPRWTYPVDSLARVDLTRAKIDRKQDTNSQLPVGGWSDEGSRFALSLIRPDNTQLCEIKSLTEGEARWMADVVMRQFPEWFR